MNVGFDLVGRAPRVGIQITRPANSWSAWLLFLCAASGLVLAIARATPAVPLLLALHLGAVLALFLTLPYGKFAHAVYRGAAVLQWAIEKRQPLTLKLGGE